MSVLAERMVEVHDALTDAGLPHAFGGALALAWCTRRARATIDIDINVFVPVGQAGNVLEALPAGTIRGPDDLSRLEREGQVRLWWDDTPVDVFLDVTPFHRDVAGRVRWERFMDRALPFLACQDLAVFKAFFDRTRDWADLEDMHAAGCLDVDVVVQVVAGMLGEDDERITRLRRLAG